MHRQVEQLCVTRGLGFSISAKLTERLRPAIDALPESVWSAYPWENEAEWTEFRYQPNGWSREHRLLVKRKPWYEKEQRVTASTSIPPSSPTSSERAVA